MADDPGKDKKRKKRKIEHGELRFVPQQTKQQQNNIIPFPSLITNKTEQTRNGHKKQTHTQTYRLRRRMADDPGKDKKRKKRKIEHGELRF